MQSMVTTHILYTIQHVSVITKYQVKTTQYTPYPDIEQDINDYSVRCFIDIQRGFVQITRVTYTTDCSSERKDRHWHSNNS